MGKFYVVWRGRVSGVYAGWNSCKKQVYRFSGAQYIGFNTHEEAETAFTGNYNDFVGLKRKKKTIIVSNKIKNKLHRKMKSKGLNSINETILYLFSRNGKYNDLIRKNKLR